MKLAERLMPEISAIYYSDLKRALETAETIVATYGKFEVCLFCVVDLISC